MQIKHCRARLTPLDSDTIGMQSTMMLSQFSMHWKPLPIKVSCHCIGWLSVLHALACYCSNSEVLYNKQWDSECTLICIFYWLVTFCSKTLEVNHIDPIENTHHQGPGQPRKQLKVELLHAAMAPGHRITVSKLARLIGIHRNTLRHYLKKCRVDYQHTPITDGELDLLIHYFCHLKPQSGLHYLAGSLSRYGLRIQRHRIASSLQCVDPLGRVLRQQATIHRRQYQVSCPNALWHMDGHHKLIHWGIVIHGIIDGYSQTVCFPWPLTLQLQHWTDCA